MGNDLGVFRSLSDLLNIMYPAGTVGYQYGSTHRNEVVKKFIDLMVEIVSKIESGGKALHTRIDAYVNHMKVEEFHRLASMDRAELEEWVLSNFDKLFADLGWQMQNHHKLLTPAPYSGPRIQKTASKYVSYEWNLEDGLVAVTKHK